MRPGKAGRTGSRAAAGSRAARPATTTPTPKSPAYVPVAELGGRPHIVVDGGGRPGSVLVLSHWPTSSTPRRLARDLSAEIAFDCLSRPRLTAGVEAVTNDHFDQDGLVGVHALTDPERALERRAMLEEVARAGDFSVVRDRDAARVAFALARLSDAELSSLASPEGVGGAGDGGRPVGDWTATCYRELLGLLPEMCDQVWRFRPEWEEEDAAYAASIGALADGRVTIEERPQADLAVVRIAEGFEAGSGTVICQRTRLAVHPAALHGATGATRVLLVQGRRYCCYQRYETWVRYVTAPLRGRADLVPLAARLSGEERDGTRWVADPPAAIVPTLSPRPAGAEDDAGSGRTAIGLAHESSIDPERLVALVGSYLAEAPPAWDPWRGGPVTR